MTQDEIIEMARFAGIRIDSFGFQGGFIEEFEAFAKLVAAKEREEERECSRCKDYKAMYIKVRDELAAEQQRGQA